MQYAHATGWISCVGDHRFDLLLSRRPARAPGRPKAYGMPELWQQLAKLSKRRLSSSLNCNTNVELILNVDRVPAVAGKAPLSGIAAKNRREADSHPQGRSEAEEGAKRL